MAGSLYTLEAKLKDNVTKGLDNITSELKNSAKASRKASDDLKKF